MTSSEHHAIQHPHPLPDPTDWPITHGGPTLQGQSAGWPPPASPPQAPPATVTFMPADPYAPSEAWSSPYEDFTAPSGQRCLLRKMGLEDLVRAGILDHYDQLSGIVENELVRPAQGQPPRDVGKAMRDPKTLAYVVPMMDKVILAIVAKPTLHPAPAEGEERVVGRAYIDAVSLGDKLAVFNHAVGDLEDLKSFRAKPDQSA